MRSHSVNRIHQFAFLSGDSSREVRSVGENIKAIKLLYPKALYKLWTPDEIRDVLTRFFPKAVLFVYDHLVPEVYKRDLAKYALLYVYGGLYVDLDVRCLKPFHIPIDKKIAAFRNPAFASLSWTVLEGGFLWALPRREEFLEAINMIIANFNKNYHGLQPSYPTGGVVLGRAFLRVMTSSSEEELVDNQYVGQIRFVTPDNGMTNMGYVTQDGTVIALKNKNHEAEIESSFVNNYKKLWEERRIYRNTAQEGENLLVSDAEVGALRERELVSHLEGGYSNILKSLFENMTKRLVSFWRSK